MGQTHDHHATAAEEYLESAWELLARASNPTTHRDDKKSLTARADRCIRVAQVHALLAQVK